MLALWKDRPDGKTRSANLLLRRAELDSRASGEFMQQMERTGRRRKVLRSILNISVMRARKFLIVPAHERG
jgi:hypothetical protein